LCITFVFMTAWAFEARHSPPLRNEISKTKLHSTRQPQAGINTLLPAGHFVHRDVRSVGICIFYSQFSAYTSL